jgi:hypothetical protein
MIKLNKGIVSFCLGLNLWVTLSWSLTRLNASCGINGLC